MFSHQNPGQFTTALLYSIFNMTLIYLAPESTEKYFFFCFISIELNGSAPTMFSLIF